MHLRSLLLLGFVITWLAACTTTKAPVPSSTPSRLPSAIEIQSQNDEERIMREQPPGDFKYIPGWRNDNLTEALPALLSSCEVLIRRPRWDGLCVQAQLLNKNDNVAIQEFFEKNFKPYLLKQTNGTETGLVTGYYEPLLRGSRLRHGEFQTPLHAAPADLVPIGSKKSPQRGRQVGSKVLPYWTREEIDRYQILAGQEIVWVDDPVDAFFLQVQGSGRVFLPESGETIRLAFADHNGQPYKSIGRYLIDKGELTLSQASAQGIKDWVKQHPDRKSEVLNANPRYVFFKETVVLDPEHGPRGALNVPLTPERSIAIDPAFIPLGVPVFLETTLPNSNVPLRRLMMAQDTGSAIKGNVRADFFWGFGDAAGDLAGAMKQQGRMWVLLPK